MRALRICAIALKLTLALVTPAGGQVPASESQEAAPSSPHGVSGSVNVGVGSYGFAGELSVAVNTSAGEFIARSAGTEEFTILTGPPRSASDFGVLYGRRSSGARGWLRIAGGVAYVESVERGEVKGRCFIFCDYEEERSRTVGLALQLDGVWAISHHFGVGLNVFADANADASFLGGTLGVYFGRLR